MGQLRLHKMSTIGHFATSSSSGIFAEHTCGSTNLAPNNVMQTSIAKIRSERAAHPTKSRFATKSAAESAPVPSSAAMDAIIGGGPSNERHLLDENLRSAQKQVSRFNSYVSGEPTEVSIAAGYLFDPKFHPNECVRNGRAIDALPRDDEAVNHYVHSVRMRRDLAQHAAESQPAAARPDAALCSTALQRLARMNGQEARPSIGDTFLPHTTTASRNPETRKLLNMADPTFDGLQRRTQPSVEVRLRHPVAANVRSSCWEPRIASREPTTHKPAVAWSSDSGSAYDRKQQLLNISGTRTERPRCVLAGRSFTTHPEVSNYVLDTAGGLSEQRFS